MKLTREARRQSRELFRLAMVDGRLDEARLRAVFDGVVAGKPRHSLQILKEITRLVRLETARHHAVVESAVPLNSGQATAFASALGAHREGLTTEFRHNPDLIAGVRVQIGCDVWDGSVRSRLEAIKNQI